MRITTLIAFCCIMLRLTAQTYVPPNFEMKINNTEDLIKVAKANGIKQMAKIVEPIDLVYIDSSYASILIDLEFKQNFCGKHYDNSKICIYELPEITLKIEDEFNNIEARKKLFSYYSNLPKFSKSDTIYQIYRDLDGFLSVLVKSNSLQLTNKLKKDYLEWSKIAQKSPPKKYASKEERSKLSIVESQRLQPNDYYVDCNYVMLQIAGALNYLNVAGFDDVLLTNLKHKQTNPYAKNYSFPKPLNINREVDSNSVKRIKTTNPITNFTKDKTQIINLIITNFGNCRNAHLIEILEKESVACLTFSCDNGSEFFRINLENDNNIKIELIWTVNE